MTEYLKFLDTDGTEIAAPQEWRPAWIEVDLPAAEWESVTLFRQGQKLDVGLRKFQGQTRILAEWERANPGHYQLRLERHGEQLKERTITVLSRKIAPEAYQQLLEDLESKLPVRVAIALQRLGAFTGIDFQPWQKSSLAEDLNRLRRAIDGVDTRPGLAKILPQLGRDPHYQFQSEDRWVRREQVRRPAITGLVRALRPDNLYPNRQPKRVLDRHVEQTVDVYENQLVKLFVHQCDRLLQRVQARLRDQVEAGRRDTFLTEVEALGDRLQRAKQQARFLHEVSLPGYSPEHLTMVLLKNPVYNTALECYLEFRKSSTIRLLEPRLDAPLENLPYLYELWCTLEVMATLLEMAKKHGYRIEQERLIHRQQGEHYLRILPDGQAAIVLKHPNGAKVELIPQRTYASSTRGLRSATLKKTPDIAIEVYQSDQAPKIYIFDPKYKLDSEAEEVTPSDKHEYGKPKAVDINKMHTYRDAIRDANDKTVVEHAAILYPGANETYHGKGIAALSAIPGKPEELGRSLRELLDKALDKALDITLEQSC